MHPEIHSYNEQQEVEHKEVCALLAREIDRGLPDADVSEIDRSDLQRWLKKAQEIRWDYRNLVRRKGRLEKLK